MSRTGQAKQIRVLVVDDSAVVRQVLRELLESDPAIAAVETASDGRTALRKAKRFAPDVITMDVEMPGLDGLATLERFMKERPRPVIMLSAYTSKGAHRTIRALELGAIDFIQKPAGGNSKTLPAVGHELLAKVKSVSRWKALASGSRNPAAERRAPPDPRRRAQPALRSSSPQAVVAIGASTGGTEAIREILIRLPSGFPGAIVITIHMPAGYTKAFADRLNELCDIDVKEGEHGDLLRPGRALVAPGHSHMVTRRDGDLHHTELNRQPEVNGHRPSVDVLFESAARAAGHRCVGVILTGMGRDGASGLMQIKDAGGVTIGQDESSSAVYGMPKAAADEGAVMRVGHLRDLADEIERGVAEITQRHPAWSQRPPLPVGESR